jgi:hypothetical protein
MSKYWEPTRKPQASDSFWGRDDRSKPKQEKDYTSIYGPSLRYGPSIEEMAQSVKLTGTRRPVDWSRVTVQRQEEQKSSIDKPTVGMRSDRNSPVAGAMTFSEIAMPVSANKTLGVEDPSTKNLESQASAPRAANNPDLEKTFQAWLSFQKSIRNRALELEVFWEQIKKQNPEFATNIENLAQQTYSVLLNYVLGNRGLSIDDKDFSSKHVWKNTIIYYLMAQHWEQARRIIRGETAERRQQDRQSLHNLAQATNLRREQLDNFFLGEDDRKNSFGGIKDHQKLRQVQAKAGEIYSRVTAYDSGLLYNPPGIKQIKTFTQPVQMRQCCCFMAKLKKLSAAGSRNEES